ncbi:hypothetical protein [Sphingomonas qomolangmaensis]|uniref:Uncharacterized protein n=1 Tax=Sphingomonas qomolangmaensis TaxID=2918765 RepID=A0ABY5LAS7_9SPHN|nr:hypothetical protein [Sphingomonas qomolangmaensis]UUL84055.1 hypothetical protein NMP03_07685 [Sphingomonas qomolangmaensis]
MSPILSALALFVGDGHGPTIVIENSSARALTLIAAEIPSHYAPLPQTPLLPTASIRTASRRGKIFVPHDHSKTEAVRIHYADDIGNGCVFHVATADHSASWKKLKPRAERRGNAVCEARTGRTITDFVYVVR